jgi:hypothetical protein
MKIRNAIPFFLILLIVYACSVLKKEDSNQEVRDFLVDFQASLLNSEDIVLKQFDAQQSRESLISAIRILQNKEHEFIVCESSFNAATIDLSGEFIQVTVPVAFRSRSLEEEYHENTSIIMWLQPKRKSYAIAKLDAVEFYNTFAKIKNEMQWTVEREREFQKREPVYALAKTLEANFDSLIWFTTYREKKYFYAVVGNWTNWFDQYAAKRPAMDAKVGLIDESGEVIVPIAYSLVGTLGFSHADIVEVNQDGKYGYFDLSSRREVIPALYDLIIPYGRDGAKVIVKSDSAYGYYDEQYQFTAGFPNDDAAAYVKSFKFIPANLHIDIESYALSEIPRRDHAGDGIVVMPSYLAATGVFEEVLHGISPTEFPLNGYTDYVETKNSVLVTITESMRALVTTIKERYLDGREEFYEHNNLVFIGPNEDTLSVTKLYSKGDVSFRSIGALLEAKTLADEFWYEGADWEDAVPNYHYYLIGDDLQVMPLRSKRNFKMTEFVKLDSSYLTGDFQRLNPESGETMATSFLSVNTMQYMLNEILASYGVKFFHQDGQYDQFPQYKNISEKTRDEIASTLSEIDAHNVAFLERMIEMAGTGKPI